MGKCKYLNTQFGDFDIISYDKITKKYLAKCRKCGLEKTYTTGTFTAKENHNKGLCTCSASGIQIGDQFGRLTVIKRDLEKQNKDRAIYWICKCSCGNITSVTTKCLKNGAVSSCGCLSNERRAETSKKHALNLTGKKYGLLTALELLDSTDVRLQHKNLKNRYWLCQCECGNYHIVEQSDLRKNKVSSCGCLKSKGEYKINHILQENQIMFIQQYTFNDLKSENNIKYKFDFAIFENNQLSYLIEYDGEQHFNKNFQFNNNEENFEIIQKRDKIKNNYCKQHNIPLIRIPYTQYNNLTINDLILKTTKFLI